MMHVCVRVGRGSVGADTDPYCVSVGADTDPYFNTFSTKTHQFYSCLKKERCNISDTHL